MQRYQCHNAIYSYSSTPGEKNPNITDIKYRKKKMSLMMVQEILRESHGIKNSKMRGTKRSTMQCTAKLQNNQWHPWAVIAHLVQRLATGWTVRGSNPSGEARFSATVHTSCKAHPASYTVGTGSFQGVKRPGRDIEHPPLSSSEVKERVELYPYSPFGLSWAVLGWPLSLPVWWHTPRNSVLQKTQFN